MEVIIKKDHECLIGNKVNTTTSVMLSYPIVTSIGHSCHVSYSHTDSIGRGMSWKTVY